MPHTEITFINTSEETNQILIALLSDAGFEGFEETETNLKGYAPQNVFDLDAIDRLAAKYHFDYSVNDIRDTNWNKVWESNFQPVVVDDFCSIRADFHDKPGNAQHEIIITPKMSFGTGHHATTFMMIRQMQHIDFHGTTILDFGTGTGVLAILAQKLGATDITAIDNDEWSIVNAEENFKRNRSENITLLMAESIGPPKKFDVILANITRNVIMDNFSSFARQLTNNGILLLSGLLPEDEEDIVLKAAEYQFQLHKQLSKDNWISLCFSR